MASVLGLRLCTPAFFSEGNFKAQNQFDNTVKMAPMIDTALYVHVTKKVKERHKVEWALLQFAFSVQGSKWKEVAGEIAFNAFQSKKQSCLLVDGVGPLHEFVRNSKSVDRVRTAKGKWISVITKAHLEEDLDVQ